MNWETMGDIMVSVMILTPGLIVFGVLLVVGLLMMLERSGVFAAMQRGQMVEQTAGAAMNPAAGAVVAGLKEAVASERSGDATQEKTKKKTA